MRYYDVIDLFKPIEIDLFANYRYYSEEQIDDLNLICELKDVVFSLKEIKNYWNNFDNVKMLQKKQELLNEINNINDKIRKIDYRRIKL